MTRATMDVTWTFLLGKIGVLSDIQKKVRSKLFDARYNFIS